MQVWCIDGSAKTPLPNEDIGKFYSGDCYIVLYTYHSGDRKEDYFLCCWIGTDSVEVTTFFRIRFGIIFLVAWLLLNKCLCNTCLIWTFFSVDKCHSCTIYNKCCVCLNKCEVIWISAPLSKCHPLSLRKIISKKKKERERERNVSLNSFSSHCNDLLEMSFESYRCWQHIFCFVIFIFSVFFPGSHFSLIFGFLF